MDLLQTVRKEGSRGGRGDFKWDDVKGDQHREHYLGHSLMAPVGRWQKGRDLSWYSKSSAPPTEAARQSARTEELRRIKEAEAEAMAAALGLPVSKTVTSANAIPVSGNARDGEIKRAVDDVADGDATSGKGLGFGSYRGSGAPDNEDEVLPGTTRGRETRDEPQNKQQKASRYERSRAEEHPDKNDWNFRDRRRDSRREDMRGRDIRHKHSKRRHNHSRSRSRSRYERRSEKSKYRDHAPRVPDYHDSHRSERREGERRRHRDRSFSRTSSDDERHRSYRRRSRSPRTRDRERPGRAR